MANMAVQILLSLRDGLTGPARNASRSFTRMGRDMRSASASITASSARSQAAVTRLGTSANRSANAVGRLAQNMRNMRAMSLGMGIGGGVGVMAAFPLAGMVKNAADYETALINIRKVWGGTEAEYQKTIDGLTGLHSKLPLTRIEIAKVLEEGVRAGLGKTADELVNFTRDAAAFGVAFSLPIDDAAPKLAKIRSALHMTGDEFRTLGDTMNTLANRMATNEQELLEYVRRIGPNAMAIGGKDGLNDILAIGAAQMAAGVKREVAATGMRTLMARIGQGSKPTRDALKALGFNPDQIKGEFVNDIYGTTFKILSAIAKAPAERRAELLSKLAGMKAYDAFSPLFGNLGLLQQGEEIVSSEDRITMDSELIRRVGSLNSLLTITHSLLENLSDSIVMAWKPQIVWTLEKLQELAIAMKGSPVLQWGAAILAGVAGLSLIALPLGLLGASIFSGLVGLRALGSVLRTLVMIGRPIAGILQGVGQGLAMGLAGFARQTRLVYRYAGAFRALRFALGGLVRLTAVGAVLTTIIEAWPLIKSAATGFWSGIQSGWEGSEIQRGLQWLADRVPGLGGVFDDIKRALNYIFGGTEFDTSALTQAFELGEKAARVLLNPLQAIREAIEYIRGYNPLAGIAGQGAQNGALAGAAAGAQQFQLPTAPAPQGIAGPTTNNNQRTYNTSVNAPVSINVQTNADPGAIGAAAGNAIGATVRRGMNGDGN